VCLKADCDYSFGLLVCLVQQAHRLESRARIRRSAWLWERDSPATDRSIYLRPGICLSLTVNCPTNAPIDRPGCCRDPEPYSFRFFQRPQVSFRPTPSLLPLAEYLETAPPPPKIEDPFPSLWNVELPWAVFVQHCSLYGRSHGSELRIVRCSSQARLFAAPMVHLRPPGLAVGLVLIGHGNPIPPPHPADSSALVSSADASQSETRYLVCPPVHRTIVGYARVSNGMHVLLHYLRVGLYIICIPAYLVGKIVFYLYILSLFAFNKINMSNGI
jgi:hypothetical protein